LVCGDVICKPAPYLEKVNIPEESTTKENVQMPQKPRRTFIDEYKAKALRIV